MTHTPVFLSFRSSGLRRSAALAILPLFLASCGSSTSTASNTPAPSNTTVTSSPSASSATGSASSSAAKKTSTPCLEPDEARKLKLSSSRKPLAPTAVLRSPPTSPHGMLYATRRTSPPAPKLKQQEPSAWHSTRRTRQITPTLRHGYALSMTITWQAER